MIENHKIWIRLGTVAILVNLHTNSSYTIQCLKYFIKYWHWISIELGKSLCITQKTHTIFHVKTTVLPWNEIEGKQNIFREFGRKVTSKICSYYLISWKNVSCAVLCRWCHESTWHDRQILPRKFIIFEWFFCGSIKNFVVFETI